MAYRAGTVTLADALDDLNRAASNVKSAAQAFKNRIDTGSITYYEADSILSQLRTYRAIMESARTTSGLGQYAKDQNDDQAYDISAEYLAMRTALDDVLNTMRTALNNQSNLVTYDTSWVPTPATFTNLTSISTKVDTLIASIA